MPCFVLEAPETHANVIRPVTHDIVTDLIQFLQCPSKPTLVLHGDTEQTALTGSKLDDDSRGIKTNYTERVLISYQDDYVESGVLTTPVKRKEFPPVFHDLDLEVVLRPIYVHTNATLSLEFRFPSKTQAERFRDTIRRRMSQGMQARLHEIHYHFQIPPVFFQILTDIHRKREAVAGYGEGLQQWLKRCFIDRMTVTTTQSGDWGNVVIPEKQIQVQGWLDFQTQPEKPEKEEEGANWTVSFEYTFEYDKILSIAMDFPFVVHNQLLDEKYTTTEAVYDVYNVNRLNSNSGHLNDAFSLLNYEHSTAYRGVVIPEFDDWKPTFTHDSVLPVFTCLICVELSDPHQVLNLMELGNFSLTQPIVNFIYRERQWLTQHLNSVFHITVYRNKMGMSETAIYVDEDLNVRTVEPLNPRGVYHCRLSIVWMLNLLSQRARDALRNDPLVCYQIVDWISQLQHPRLPLSNSIGNKTFKGRFDTSILGTPVNRPSFDSPSGADYDRINHQYKNRFGVIKPTQQTSHAQTLYPRPAPPQSPYLSDRLVVLGKKVVTRKSFESVAEQIQSIKPASQATQRTGMLTVMQAGIITHAK